MHHTRRSPCGTTLVEVVIALALFSTFGTSAFLAIEAASRSYRSETVVAQLDFLVHQALQDVSERMRAADFASITPAPTLAPSSVSSVDFQGSLGFRNGAAEWGPIERLAFESDPMDPENGLDDDDDGLVDEGRVVWAEDPDGAGGRRAVLCSWVSNALEGEVRGNGIDDNGNGLVDERGFCVEFVGQRAIARITLERRDNDGRQILRSATRTITPRNTPEE